MKYTDRYLKSLGYSRVTEIGLGGAHSDVYKDETGVHSESVKALANAYDQAPPAKVEAKQRIKDHAAELINAIYPHIDPNATDVIGFYNYSVDMWQGGALTGRLLQLKNIHDTVISTIADINNMNDWQLIDAYDAVNTPTWP